MKFTLEPPWVDDSATIGPVAKFVNNYVSLNYTLQIHRVKKPPKIPLEAPGRHLGRPQCHFKPWFSSFELTTSSKL